MKIDFEILGVQPEILTFLQNHPYTTSNDKSSGSRNISLENEETYLAKNARNFRKVRVTPC